MSNRGSRAGGGRGGRGGRGGGGGGPSSSGDRGGTPPPRGRGRGGFDSGGPPRGGGGGFDRGGPPRGGGGGRGFDNRGRGGPPGGGGGRGGFGGPLIFREGAPAQLPPRLSDSTQQALITSFKTVPATAERPLRPGFGTRGNPVTLRANFFAVRLPKVPVFRYNVEITPKKSLGERKARIFQLLERSALCQPHLSYIAHDKSERLVSTRQLPQPLDIQIPNYTDFDDAPVTPGAPTYVVSIKFLDELRPEELASHLNGDIQSRNYDPLPLISSLNLVLQQHAQRNGVRVGQGRFFFPQSLDTPKISFTPDLYVKQGFFVSVRPAFKQLMVNVNACMTAFVEPGNLAERLINFGQSSHGSMPTLSKAMIRSIKVRTLHLHHKKKLEAIGTTTARNTFFDCEEFGGKISVEQYFRKKYNITLRHAHDLPVVNIGNSKFKNWVPAELCVIEDGCVFRDKVDIVKIASVRPRIAGDAITNTGFPILGFSPRKTPLQGFDVDVDTEMSVVPGRELSPPSIQYRGNPIRANNGSWNINDVKFLVGGIAKAWWVLVVKEVWPHAPPPYAIQGSQDERLKNLVTGFTAKMKRSGVVIPDGLPKLLGLVLPKLDDDPGRLRGLTMIRNRLETTLQESDKDKLPRPNFILVLLEKRDNYIYPGIKKIGDVELGIMTLHMQLSKVLGDSEHGNKRDQYLSNVALKVNTKLGGINHVLDDNAMKWLRKKSTIMVGIDVTHPGPGSRDGSPSIAAVVASVDNNFVQFPASLRIQKSKQEMVDGLSDMIVERLQVYERKNKALPSRVFVYRDGVSEGQFDDVVKKELPSLLEAFRKLSTQARGSQPYRPTLSIIICGKRHHAKFWPTNSQHADRNGNTRPGTVVDKGVTGVFDFDFYLQAHAGIQGFVKSTHYTVVYDENSLTADEIQQGTNDTSYLYARATKAVSLIPAAYYADRACERGRCYLNDFLASDAATSTAGGEPSPAPKGFLNRLAEKEEREKRVFDAASRAWGKGLHDNVKERMFYI